MFKISLRKLIKKEGRALLEQLQNTFELTISIHDVNGDVLFAKGNPALEHRHLVAVEDKTIGWVCGENHVETIVSLLNFLAKQELEKKQLGYEVLEGYREMSLILNMANKLSPCIDLEAIANLTIQEATKLIPATSAAVLLLDSETGLLKTIAASGDAFTLETTVALGEGIIGSVTQNGTADIINEVASDPRNTFPHNTLHKGQITGVSSMICVSLCTDDRPIGAIAIAHDTPIFYSARDLKLLTRIASPVAPAIGNTLLHAELYAVQAEYLQKLEIEVAERTKELRQEIYERHRAEASLQDANQKLQQLADLDGLTNVANRRRFDEYLLDEWDRAGRDRKPLSLIMCDVDYFKKYNDTYGHQGGDDCLRKVAQAMNQSAKRPADMVFRYGGEEFAVLLPSTDMDGAMTVANQIRDSVKALQIEHEASLVSKYISVSLGVASMVPIIDAAPTILVTIADQALYQAKNDGRDRIYAIG
ncbi:diguanylate cyclase [Tumidithrix elongata RA019]|uniref:Diguanylate cyclase n=1 Tax=Tumidithrix elongata BACA0141 TaxID=2716417 RepID=A0AAW9PVP2_9CYAN|nr:diguanylate cyclase [Tumidithrix elongata RA019]